MAKVQGVVFKVYPKEFPAKGGKPAVTWYSIKLEDDKVYYRCKAERYAGIAEAGNRIELEHNGVAEDGSQAEVVKGSVRLAAKPVLAGTGSSSASVVNSSGPSRESSIHYQSARKDALQYVDIMVRANAIKLPAKESARLAALDAIVDRITAQYFDDIGNFGAVARVNGTDEGSDDPESAKDEDEE